MSEPLLITVRQAASLLGCHPLSLRKAIARGVLTVVRPLSTRSVRLRRTDVLALAEPAPEGRS